MSNKEIFLYLLFDKSFEKSIFVENVISSELIDDVYSYQNPKVSDEIAIYHVQYKKGKLLNLLNESPGVQTNSIMEFIFHKNSDIPILIDQPEDNVDNYARYNELTKWIAKAKFYRQIILVSHDANIVINGDTENLIAAEYENGVFEFTYGALEHGNNLEIAAEVLDGGKVAIRRRAKKYGL